MGKSPSTTSLKARFAAVLPRLSTSVPTTGYLPISVYTNRSWARCGKVTFYGGLSVLMVATYGTKIHARSDFGSAYNQTLIVPTSRIASGRYVAGLRRKTHRYKVMPIDGYLRHDDGTQTSR